MTELSSTARMCREVEQVVETVVEDMDGTEESDEVVETEGRSEREKLDGGFRVRLLRELRALVREDGLDCLFSGWLNSSAR